MPAYDSPKIEHYPTLLKPPVVIEERLFAEELIKLRGKNSLETVLAQNNDITQDSSPNNAVNDYSKYKTVEDVLKDTQFKHIKIEDVEKETANGKAILFLYDPNDSFDKPRTPSINMALMWKAVAPEYQDIKFLALKYERQVIADSYISLGFTEVPSYALFSNGKRLYLQGKAPSKDELSTAIEISRRNLHRLRNF